VASGITTFFFTGAWTKIRTPMAIEHVSPASGLLSLAGKLSAKALPLQSILRKKILSSRGE
jgi:hypothetical protein